MWVVVLGPQRRPTLDSVARGLDLPDFSRRVAWRGMRPRLLQVRHQALGVTKRVLGNAGYERLRERLL